MDQTAQAMLQLRDIHLPGAPAFWPPAPGWWFIAAVLLAALAWLTALGLRRWRIRRQRQRLRRAIARLEDQLARERTPQALAHIAILLRRLALLRFGRQRVAALTGQAWLHFLDESGGQGRFTDGPGRVLATGPYRRELAADLDTAALGALLRQWVQTNAGA